MKNRSIPLRPEAEAAIKIQIDAFRQKFGREPGPDDPLFFDPDSDTPRPYPQEKFDAEWDRMLEDAVAKGALRPEFAYAGKKTRRLVTESNRQYLSDADLQEWNDAVQEFLDHN